MGWWGINKRQALKPTLRLNSREPRDNLDAAKDPSRWGSILGTKIGKRPGKKKPELKGEKDAKGQHLTIKTRILRVGSNVTLRD